MREREKRGVAGYIWEPFWEIKQVLARGRKRAKGKVVCAALLLGLLLVILNWWKGAYCTLLSHFLFGRTAAALTQFLNSVHRPLLLCLVVQRADTRRPFVFGVFFRLSLSFLQEKRCCQFSLHRTPSPVKFDF